MMTNPFDHHFGRPGLDFGCFTSSHKLLVDCFVFWECFFFFDNRREYIEKAIKRIAKEKYKGYKKEKRKKLIYYSKQQEDYLRFLITPQFDTIRRS